MSRGVRRYRPYRAVGSVGNNNAQQYDIRAVGAKVVALVRRGSHLGTACRAAGVPVSVERLWRRLGREGVGSRVHEHVANEDHVWYFEELERALGEVESEVVGHWLGATAENWQAARDFLARRFPQRWGNKEQRKIEVRGGQQMELQLVWEAEEVQERCIAYDPRAEIAQGDARG